MSDTDSGLSAQQQAAAPPAVNSYTAIIYFHGMGAPRRHEEISRLTDALDQFSSNLDVGSVGRLREQRVLFEPSRTDEDEDVAFVRIYRVVKRFGRSYRRESRLRIYEGFWSPSTVGGYSWIVVLFWLISRFGNPIRVLRHPWRAHQRLKLATLYRMSRDNRDTSLERRFRQLERLYIEYENWGARRLEPRGGFDGFLRQIDRDTSESNPHALEVLHVLAQRWRWRFRVEQMQLLFAIGTATAAAVAAALLILYLAVSAAAIVVPSIRDVSPFAPVPYSLIVTPLSLAILLYAFVRAKYYLSTFWSDVMFWTTQEEKDERFSRRREILISATRTLTHVLRDPNCARVVVIGHSLGSAIAHETLLRLGRRRTARAGGEMPLELARLEIISHFVTIGSPIDWIHYFFELHDSRYHRYNRIKEVLKGNTNDPPFKLDAIEGTKWLNVWDDADPISTTLFSPRGRLPNAQSIRDIWSPSSHRVSPVKAHSAYFSCPLSLQPIFWISIFGRLPKQLDVDAICGGVRGFLFRFVRPLQWIVAALLVWTLLSVALSAMIFGFVESLAVILAGLIAILVILQLVGWVADRTWPMQLERVAAASEH
jgi:hypothetical protein